MRDYCYIDGETGDLEVASVVEMDIVGGRRLCIICGELKPQRFMDQSEEDGEVWICKKHRKKGKAKQ